METTPRMGGQPRTAEEIIARIARGAHGVVSAEELREAGLSAKEIELRVRKGALIPQYRGVYRVGHQAPSVLARYMAAVKACGPGALLCGLAAAYLLGLLKGPPPPPEVLTPTERKPKGLKPRRSRNPDPRDGTKHKGIPVTTVPVTLVHLAAVLDPEDLARACHEAGVRYGTTPNHVRHVLQRMPNAKGAATLRAIISGDVKVLLSKLEKRFIERLIERGLPLPDTNRIVDGRYVDCRWKDKQVTVELVSFKFHNSRHSWDRDLDREREAYARDDAFRRYTYKDVFEDPTRMYAELEKLLA
jgi:Transcriptional regulator, AbiEi antitoxin